MCDKSKRERHHRSPVHGAPLPQQVCTRAEGLLPVCAAGDSFASDAWVDRCSAVASDSLCPMSRLGPHPFCSASAMAQSTVPTLSSSQFAHALAPFTAAQLHPVPTTTREVALQHFVRLALGAPQTGVQASAWLRTGFTGIRAGTHIAELTAGALAPSAWPWPVQRPNAAVRQLGRDRQACCRLCAALL